MSSSGIVLTPTNLPSVASYDRLYELMVLILSLWRAFVLIIPLWRESINVFFSLWRAFALILSLWRALVLNSFPCWSIVVKASSSTLEVIQLWIVLCHLTGSGITQCCPSSTRDANVINLFPWCCRTHAVSYHATRQATRDTILGLWPILRIFRARARSGAAILV